MVTPEAEELDGLVWYRPLRSTTTGKLPSPARDFEGGLRWNVLKPKRHSWNADNK